MQCPPGRWRLAAPEELSQTMLFVSHILVRHRQVAGRAAPFAPSQWTPEDPPPARSRDEAYAIAAQTLFQVRLRPTAFADLARVVSEDVTTRSSGGSLGGEIASTFSHSGGILDCLAALKPGESSEVIETSLGYEILLRRPVPPEVHVAGQRILVAYDGSLRVGSIGSSRSRSEALGIARKATADARRGVPFDKVLADYSDLKDEANHGDLGLWSNHEVSGMPREIEALASMKPGDVSEPIDSPLGFEVILSTEPKARPRYAASFIKMAFYENGKTDDPNSKTNVQKKVDGVLRVLKGDPAQFAAFQTQYCCKDPHVWSPGRMSTVLTNAVAALGVGQIADQPQMDGSEFVIAKRVDPLTVPVETVRFELPAPSKPNIDELVKRARPEFLAKYVRGLASEIDATLKLTDTRKAQLDSLHESLAAAISDSKTADERVDLVERTFAEIQGALGEQDFSRYRALVEGKVSEYLMGRGQLHYK
jgi:hypothetical protein